ncbi:DUF4233 domain-containing protein [Nocardioides zeae]|uniref:DUF4233 domain-containing protein n=1 Tax=Nocardioides imazamoxiresistens TaxID=3231893 RepID=A0ABU3PRP3_9ACTN|nr:DUF4233 domain-containing protein [Nocardioides zeae]MDT9591866.1 DUF4233 domain-containing protein [Nocardioides zeae]
MSRRRGRDRAGEAGQAEEQVEPRVIEPGAPDDPERTKAPRRGMCAAVLTLQAIVMVLVAPVITQFTDVATGLAYAIGGGLAVACVLVAGMLRRPAGYTAGWVLQVVAIGLGVLVPIMFVTGALFAALWATADLMGRSIERQRAEAWAAYDAEHPQP